MLTVTVWLPVSLPDHLHGADCSTCRMLKFAAMAARLTSFVIVGIIGIRLIAGLIVGAQRDDDGLVDLIVHNGVVFTGEADGDMPQAVAIRGNQILKVGTNREILRMQRPQTVTIDANGAAVVPGFNDAHLHLVRGGLTLDTADLSGVTSVAEAIDRATEWAAAKPERSWIVGRGLDATVLENEERPIKAMLDEAFAKRPVQLLLSDGASAWVNSAALTLAGIGRSTPDPDSGRIVRNSKGEAIGLLEGSAV